MFDNNDCCFHNFEIKELQPIIEALEQYIIDMNKWALNKSYNPGSIADFSNLFDNPNLGNGLTWRIQEHLECGYLFITTNFLNAIKGTISINSIPYSGTSLFVSAKPGVLTNKEKDELASYLKVNSIQSNVAYPLDWEENVFPEIWQIDNEVMNFDFDYGDGIIGLQGVGKAWGHDFVFPITKYLW